MSVHYCTRELTRTGVSKPVLRNKSRGGGLKSILVLETAANRSVGDTMPVRKPMTD